MSLPPWCGKCCAGLVGAVRTTLSIVVFGVLAACTAPPSGVTSAEPEANQAGQGASSGIGLRPLVREMAVPAGAQPRSTVARVNYELSSSGSDLPPDDGLPGDEIAPREIFQRGGASWYGIQFHQRRTANGERFDMSAFTAAHRTLPFGTVVCVRSLTNGREVPVRVNDRGPFGPGRIIDLSRAAAEAIDMVGLGIKQVAITVIENRKTSCAGATVDLAALAAQSASGDDVVTAPQVPVSRRLPVVPRRR
ncbi:septal ring lytic transglycosylase RlpA family protein [Variovorax sp. RHLX14]|uniref:septal ring lytic transglycosylase RlpA family protein n=1 Tax=Variovorax sp. RHLX14 TaxID=1259731 RepID=UPI003F45F6F7